MNLITSFCDIGTSEIIVGNLSNVVTQITELAMGFFSYHG